MSLHDLYDRFIAWTGSGRGPFQNIRYDLIDVGQRCYQSVDAGVPGKCSVPGMPSTTIFGDFRGRLKPAILRAEQHRMRGKWLT